MKCIDDYEDHLFFTNEMDCYYEDEGPFDFMQTITKLKSVGCSNDELNYFRRVFEYKKHMLCNNRTEDAWCIMKFDSQISKFKYEL